MRLYIYFMNINNECIYIYHVLIMTEGDVYTGKSQTEVLMYWPSEYIKAARSEVFPVMTERTRLLTSYYMAFLALSLKRIQ